MNRTKYCLFLLSALKNRYVVLCALCFVLCAFYNGIETASDSELEDVESVPKLDDVGTLFGGAGSAPEKYCKDNGANSRSTGIINME